MKNDNIDPKRPKRIEEKSKSISKDCDAMQEKLLEKSKELGYASDTFGRISENFHGIEDHPLFEGVENSLDKYHKYLNTKTDRMFEELQNMKLDAITCSMSSSANATISIAVPHYKPSAVIQPTLRPLGGRSEYVEKFSRLNKELGKTYASVWEIFYATKSSPEKNALSSMRQAFDHFFAIVAPDIEVRNSIFFKEKKGDNPLLVYRIERLNYAANTKIKDKNLVELLISEARQAIKIYEKLQKMHSRKQLDRTKTEQVLDAMANILESWLDAIDIN